MAEYRIRGDYDRVKEALSNIGFNFSPVGQLTTEKTFPATGHFRVKGERYPVAFLDRGCVINMVNEDKPGFDSYHELIQEALRESGCVYSEPWAAEIYHWVEGIMRSEIPEKDGFSYQFGNSIWQVNPGAAILRQVESDIGGKIERAILPEGIFIFSKKIPNSEVIERAYR